MLRRTRSIPIDALLSQGVKERLTTIVQHRDLCYQLNWPVVFPKGDADELLAILFQSSRTLDVVIQMLKDNPFLVGWKHTLPNKQQSIDQAYKITQRQFKMLKLENSSIKVLLDKLHATVDHRPSSRKVTLSDAVTEAILSGKKTRRIVTPSQRDIELWLESDVEGLTAWQYCWVLLTTEMIDITSAVTVRGMIVAVTRMNRMLKAQFDNLLEPRQRKVTIIMAHLQLKVESRLKDIITVDTLIGDLEGCCDMPSPDADIDDWEYQIVDDAEEEEEEEDEEEDLPSENLNPEAIPEQTGGFTPGRYEADLLEESEQMSDEEEIEKAITNVKERLYIIFGTHCIHMVRILRQTQSRYTEMVDRASENARKELESERRYQETVAHRNQQAAAYAERQKAREERSAQRAEESGDIDLDDALKQMKAGVDQFRFEKDLPPVSDGSSTK